MIKDQKIRFPRWNYPVDEMLRCVLFVSLLLLVQISANRRSYAKCGLFAPPQIRRFTHSCHSRQGRRSDFHPIPACHHLDRTAPAMSELTKEQLLEYVKKQKLKIKKLETEIVSLKEKDSKPIEADNSTSDSALLRAEIQSLEKQIATKEAEVTSLSKSVEDLEDEKIKLVSQKNAELAEQRLLLDNIRTESTDLKEQVATLNITLFEQNTVIADLQSRVKVAESQSGNTNDHIAQLETDLTSARSNINELAAKLANALDAHKQSIEEGEAAKAQCEQLRQELTTALDTVLTQQAAQDSHAAALAVTQQRLETELKQALAEVASVVAEKTSLASELEKLRELIAVQAAEAADRVAEIAHLAAANADLQKKAETVQSIEKTEEQSPIPAQLQPPVVAG